MQSEPTTSGQALDSPATAGLSAVPLFHAAWLFAAGVTAAHWLWLQPSLALVALVAMAVLCFVAGRRGGRAQSIVWLQLAVLWCLLGAWCTWMEPHPAPATAVARLSDGLLRTVEGTVVDAGPMRGEIEQSMAESEHDEPSSITPSQRVDLRISSLEVVTDAADAQAPATGGVRLTVRWPAPNVSSLPAPAEPQSFHCGERVRAVVRLLQPEIYHDPGVWSRQDYLLDQGITSTATVSIDRVERLGLAPGNFLACRISGLQHASSTRLLALPAAMRRLPTYDRQGSPGATRLLRRDGVDVACWASVVGGGWWAMLGSYIPVILVGASVGSQGIGWLITLSEGASIVGGCCRVTPAQIAEIAAAIG